jgi:hypothetical protein
MIRTVRGRTVLVPAIALAITLALVSPTVHAQVKTFNVTGGGYAPDGLPLIPYTVVPFSLAGNANELGNYTGQGTFQILDFTGPLSAEFSSAPDVVFVAAAMNSP